MIEDIIQATTMSLLDQTEEFLQSALEKSGLTQEEFVKIYILEEGPIHMKDSYGRDLGLDFSDNTNTVIFEQELRLRIRRPEEM